MMTSEKNKTTNCECCAFYVYDDIDDCYDCDINLDEDEMSRFLSGTNSACPYFQFFDEYDLARKQ